MSWAGSLQCNIGTSARPPSHPALQQQALMRGRNFESLWRRQSEGFGEQAAPVKAVPLHARRNA